MEVLTVKELADYLNCSISSVRKLVRGFEIPFFRIGYKINFTKQAIDEWVLNQQTNNMQVAGY